MYTRNGGHSSHEIICDEWTKRNGAFARDAEVGGQKHYGHLRQNFKQVPCGQDIVNTETRN